jgi:hypothetical protein
MGCPCRSGSVRGLGVTSASRPRREDARALCRAAQAARGRPEDLRPICARLVQSLSRYAREEPGARIRARACGCPV